MLSLNISSIFQDSTMQVMVDQLKKTVLGLSVILQSDWLRRWGIEELVSEGMRYWDKHKSTPDVAAIKMHSRQIEAAILLGERGFGKFSSMEWHAMNVLT